MSKLPNKISIPPATTLIRPNCIDEKGYIPVAEIHKLSKELNKHKTQVRLCQAFLRFLEKTVDVDAISIFIPQEKSHDFRVISSGYSAMDENISVSLSPFLQKILLSDAWFLNIQLWKDVKTGESQSLYCLHCQTVVSFPLLSGDKCVGIVKLDSKKALQCSDPAQDSLELIASILANRLDDIDELEQLKQVKIASWFDTTLLAFRNWKSADDISRILNEQMDDLKSIDPSLITKGHFYLRDAQNGILIREQAAKTLHFVNDTSHKENSFIRYFFDNKEQQKKVFLQADIRKNQFAPFDGRAKAALCLRTGLTENELIPFTLSNRAPVIWVLWSESASFLLEYQDQFLNIANQLAGSYKNAYASTTQNTVDRRYLLKTQETVDELLRQNTNESLIQFTLTKMFELASETHTASYGEIKGSGDNLQFVIRNIQGETAEPLYVSASSLMNRGLWQRCWESKNMVVVNDRHAVNALAFHNLPLQDTQSALCIPVFNQEHHMTGMFSLSSLKINAYLRVQQGLLEWLAQAFTSQWQSIAARDQSGKVLEGGERETQLNCIREIIALYNRVENKPATLDYENLIQQSLKLVATTISATSWIIFKRRKESQTEPGHQKASVSYQVLEQKNLNGDYDMHLGALQHSPVDDLLGLESRSRHLLCADMSEHPAYKHLLPLLNENQKGSCLAMPVQIQRFRPHRGEKPEQMDQHHADNYGLFLFHFSKNHYTSTHLDFVKMALLLIEAFIKRQTLTEDLHTLMPSVVQSTMGAQIAHEIKNPCQPLDALVDTLTPLFAEYQAELETVFQQQGLVKDTQELLHYCAIELQRIKRHTDDLMHFSSPRKPEPSLVSLADILEELANYSAYEERKNTQNRVQDLLITHPVHITLELPKNTRLPYVKLDPFHLKMALSNLIKNAVYAITHSRQNNKAEGRVILRVKFNPEELFYPLILQIEDNGPGMSLEVKHNLFEPFYTTKASDGNGLGCTISKTMIEQFGGKLEVSSVIGSGSSFSIRFPRQIVIMNKGE